MVEDDRDPNRPVTAKTIEKVQPINKIVQKIVKNNSYRPIRHFFLYALS